MIFNNIIAIKYNDYLILGHITESFPIKNRECFRDIIAETRNPKPAIRITIIINQIRKNI